MAFGAILADIAAARAAVDAAMEAGGDLSAIRALVAAWREAVDRLDASYQDQFGVFRAVESLGGPSRQHFFMAAEGEPPGLSQDEIWTRREWRERCRVYDAAMERMTLDA